MKLSEEKIVELYRTMEQKRPIVHCITNAVTVNDCANILLAVGASPTMAHHPMEAGEITQGATSLVCNFGAIADYEAMLLAGRKAHELDHAIVVDPVGVSGSTYRREKCIEFMEAVHPTCIRGNYSEIRALMENCTTITGVDAAPEDAHLDEQEAFLMRMKRYAKEKQMIVIASGETDLMTDGIKTATGKTVWHDSVIQKMLCNEKYIGDAFLQKTYIADLFTREKRINNGELPKYYVHDCHPAIIDRGTFQKVQEELARRSSLKKTSSKAKTQLGKYCGKYVLSELLVCGECGSPYRRVIWTQKGVKRVVWRCQNRLEHGRKICKHSPTLDEGDIHDAVIFAMNELFQTQVARNAVKASISAVLAGEEQTLSLPAVELQIRNLQERQLELFQLIVSAGADCTDYDEELRQVNMAKTKLMAKKAELEKEQRGAAAFEERLAELDVELEQSCGALTDFDELTVRQLVSNIKVLDKDSLLICFKDGTEITQAMQRRQTA